MTYVDEVFAAVPQAEWSGPPLHFGGALRPWPAPLVVERHYVRPDDVAERMADHDARCAAMWAERRANEPWATIAARYGYARPDTAMNAVKRWRQTQPKRGDEDD